MIRLFVYSFLFIFLSCNLEQEPLVFDENQAKINECLLNYGDCSTLINRIQNREDSISTFLIAKWKNRDAKYRTADSLFNLVNFFFSKMPIESEIFQDFVLTKANNDMYLSDWNIELENMLLSKVKENSEFKIKLLLIKSSKLREENKINHSFSTALYAMFLKKKWNIDVDGCFQPAYVHAVNLYREDLFIRSQSYVFFFGLASNNCSGFSNPDCRKIKCLLVTNSELEEKQHSLEEEILLLNHQQFTPAIDTFIKIQFGYASLDQIATIEKLQNGINSNEICDDDFNRTTYLIDALLSFNRLEEANIYLQYLRNCNNIEEKDNEYLYLYRDQSYYLEKYNQDCKSKDLLKAFDTSRKTKEISLKRLDNRKSIHFADFAYRNNSTIMESIYALLQIQSDSLTNDEIVQQLVEGKEMFDRISNNSIVFAGRDVPKNMMNDYSSIRYEIDALEQQVNEYRDTVFKDLSIYEDIYFLYEELYEMELEIDSMPINPVVKKEVSFSSIKNHLLASNSQAIDIVATEQYYYFSFLQPDTIIVTQYERDEIDQSITVSLAQIINKKGNTNDHYDNQRLLALIQPYLDTSLHNIIIIPDLQFIQYPFEQLIVSSSKERFVSYLGDYYNISYQYNVNKITDEESRTPFINNDISIYSFTNNLTMANKHKLEDFEQIEMKYGLEEAMGILNLYSSADTIFGERLTKDNVYAHLSASILHFSTHSISNQNNILDNYLSIRDENALTSNMYGFEIKNHTLDHPLVILSSCNSGTGTYKSGAGTFSLSRDFLQAGAQTVIKTLWSVEEISTSQLMIDFHENFQAGHTASMSLTLAKQQLKNDSRFMHPFYWAGFVLEGNPNLLLKQKEE